MVGSVYTQQLGGEGNNILFKHEMCDAWGMPLHTITILDTDKDNVITDDDKYSLSKEDINKIKKLLDNKDLYVDEEILYAPVLDGTQHKIMLSNKKEIDYSISFFYLYGSTIFGFSEFCL